MNKYAEVFRLSFKMQIVWRFDVAMTVLTTFARILTAWVLWSAVFAGKTLLSGFSFDSMLSYYIICSFLTSLDQTQDISGEVSELIRTGRFSGHMVVPMNPFAFFTFMAAGKSMFHFGFSLIAALCCAPLFGIRLTVTAHPAVLPLVILLLLLGLFFMASFQYLVGILTFKYLDIGFFLHVQPAIIAFATGAMVPLALLPVPALRVLEALPFTYVNYMPAMLLTGQAGVGDAVFGLLVLLVWDAAMLLLVRFTYTRLRVRYDGVGI